MLNDEFRSIYANMADELIPRAEGMPSASDANVPTQWIEKEASFLGSEVINIDRDYRAENINVKAYNKEKYENYKYDYLTTPESEKTPTQEILLRELRLL